jgi:hypothetical protein
MTIKEFLNNCDEDDLNNVIITLVCPNEFNLYDFDNIGMCKGNDVETCTKCWESALKQ